MSAFSLMHGLYPELAEFALESPDQRTFRSHWLGLVASKLCCGSAEACSSRDGISYAAHTIHTDGHVFERGVASYTAEIETQELGLLMRGGSVMDDSVFSTRRRDELRAYRELLIPRGVVRTAMRCWMRAGSVFFLFFNKHHGERSLSGDDLQALESVLPVITLGESLHAQQAPPSERANDVLSSLTRAEGKIVALVQRGLTNIDIARLTGVKPATVRNQLYSVFRKLGVKTRTELTFVLSGAEPRVRRPEPNNAVAKLLLPQAAAGDSGDPRP